MAITLHEDAASGLVKGERSDGCAPASADSDARRLAKGVARGEESAFQEFYDRYAGRLFRLALVLSWGDEGISHEVVQSAMLTAAAKLKTVETEDHLWRWLAQVTRQHLIKQWRRQKREPVLVGMAELPETADVGEPDAALEESLDAGLRAMEESERRIIEWFYFDGLSQKEIAERLHSTPKAVSSRLERARAKLRELLTRGLSYET